MPIYEYRCRKCNREFQRLIMRAEEEKGMVCPGCGGEALSRLISRVAYHVSEQDRLQSYDPAGRQTDSFYADSRNIGLHAKKRAQQLGVDLGGQFEEKLDKIRSDPSSVLDSTE